MRRSKPKAAPDIVHGVKEWVTWFAGAVTGIAALFYATGYLSMRAHADLLGLSGFMQLDHDELLQEGARFFVVAGAATLQAVLAATAALAILSLLVVGLRRVLRRLLQRPRLQSFVPRWTPLASLGSLARQVAFGLVALFFLWTLWDDIESLRNPLCVTNALYRAPDLRSCPKDYDAQSLLAGLQDGASQALQRPFTDLLLFGLGHALFLTGVAAWLARPWPARRWLVLPFVVAVVLMSLLIPMAYGVMVKPVRYPRIVLTLSDHGDHSVDGKLLYLVRRDDKGIVAWDATRRAIVWWPLSAIARADVDGVDNPLSSSARGKP